MVKKLIILGLFGVLFAEESPFFPCCRQPSDHDPVNMFEVFKNPKSFLGGPNSKVNQTKQMHFVVVGAGIAGLTNARLLLEVGHKVTILESSGRRGGRMKTYRGKTLQGEEWYGDLGAMRFPGEKGQPIINKIFNELNIRTARFADFNVRNQSYYFIGDKYFNGEVSGVFDTNISSPDLQKLKEFYKLFQLEEEGLTEIIDNPYNITKQVIDEKILGDDLKETCLNDISLAKYVYDKMQLNPALIFVKDNLGQKAFDNFFKLFTFIRQLQAFSTLSASNTVIGLLDDEDPVETRKISGDRREIIGGVEVLSEKIYKEIERKFGKRGSRTFKCYGCTKRVTAEVKTIKDIYDDGYAKVAYELKYKRRQKLKVTKGHYVIFTPTSKIATQINFEPPLSVNKLNSLKNIHYSSSLKIFLAFSKPFWENNVDPDNKIPSIPFGENNDDTEAKLGAASFSDDLLIQTFYPSHAFHGPSLLASYTWEKDSENVYAYSDKELMEKAIDALVARHGEIARTSWIEGGRQGVVQKWDLDNHYNAAFVFYGVQDRNQYQELLLENHGKVYFSGESANKFHNGWIEAALESSIRNLIMIFPDEYEKQFGEEERENYPDSGCIVDSAKLKGDKKDCNCGMPIRATRIVGGQETEVNEYPWQVGLVSASGRVPWCGGSIISDRHVLTAAHCTVGGSTSSIRVLLGEHDTTDSVADIRTISAITDHPSYQSNTLAYDFSILTLSSPITFNRVMAPVCLPADVSSLYTGQLATVTGWGTTSYGGYQSFKLLEVDVTVTSNAQCNNAYSGGIGDYNICAADTGKDACQGDSGGPLFLTENGRSAQIGVVSWGYGCAQPEYPGVYARVTEVKDWIKRTASGTQDSNC